MNEGQIKGRVMRELKARIPHAFARRIEDLLSSGLPDIVVAHEGHTWWFEVKYLTKANGWSKALKPIQLETCRALHRNTGGRCFYLVYDDRQKLRTTSLYTPDKLGVTNPVAYWPGFNYAAIVEFFLIGAK